MYHRGEVRAETTLKKCMGINQVKQQAREFLLTEWNILREGGH